MVLSYLFLAEQKDEYRRGQESQVTGFYKGKNPTVAFVGDTVQQLSFTALVIAGLTFICSNPTGILILLRYYKGVGE